MHQPADDKKDIIIPLGHFDNLDRSSQTFDFNVSKLLRFLDSDEHLRSQVDHADKMVHLLDAKVHIDTSDPKYAHIYQGIDTIVKRVVVALSKLDPFFAECKLRQTGSIMPDVKVGLPLESDYVLETPKERLLQTGKPFDHETLFPLVQQIIAEQAVWLTDGLDVPWIIQGVKKYELIGGVCIVMLCPSSTNGPSIEDVGVTMDLVPGCIIKTTTRSFRANAEAFLHHSLEEYVEKGEVYSLYSNELAFHEFHEDECDIGFIETRCDTGCDTGFIENTIMKQLPDDTKQAFRVAKFLISEFLVLLDIPFNEIDTLDKNMRLMLYGRKPWMSSYQLRVFLLHLLIHVHGTETEQRLKGGMLVLCLFNMFKQYVMKTRDGTEGICIQAHPLLKDAKWAVFHGPCLFKWWTILDHLLEAENLADAVQQLSLLNTKKFESDDFVPLRDIGI